MRFRTVIAGAAALVALALVGAAGVRLVDGGAGQARSWSAGAPAGNGSAFPAAPAPHRYSAPGRWSYPGEGANGSGHDQSAVAGTSAADAQQRGLVRIVSTLAYRQGVSVGTGMVLAADGLVVTNHHVVEGAGSITATVVATGQTFRASVVGTDARDDIAVLALKGASGLTTVSPAAAPVRVGARVTAVGDAGGTSTLSAAEGTVTALHRSIATQSSGTAAGEHLANLIEVRADVVPGDSGGPLLGAAGAVVGMDTAASSGSARVTGYAISIRKVLRIVDRIEAGDGGGRIHLGGTAFLGVELSTRSARNTLAGVVRGTPAAHLGLAAGDRITAVAGTATRTSAALHRAIAAHAPGDRVSLTWTTPRGSGHTATVTLASGPVG